MKAVACLKVTLPLDPSITGIDNFSAKPFASVFSPKIFKTLSEGPINFIFARLAAEANEGFSLKKPYPG